jgi:hypothetical protein
MLATAPLVVVIVKSSTLLVLQIAFVTAALVTLLDFSRLVRVWRG